MRRAAFLMILFLWCSPLFAAGLVPESTSPDGKFALAFEHPPSNYSDPPPLVWLVRLPGLDHVSAQLTPSRESIYKRKRIRGTATLIYRDKRTGPNANNRQMMFETLVLGVQAQLDGEGIADNYWVCWSKDSQQVTIWAGAHKFAYASMFQLRHGRFYRFKDYFDGEID